MNDPRRSVHGNRSYALLVLSPSSCSYLGYRAEIGSIRSQAASAVTVQLGTAGTATFALADRVVTRIDFVIRGVEQSVSLECAGGLRDVRFESAELVFGGHEAPGLGDSFALLFDLNDERLGESPRVQLSFSGGRVNDMLVRIVRDNSELWDNLCASLPPDPICGPNAPVPRVPDHEILIEQLRGLPTPLSSSGVGAAEQKRREIFEQLLVHGADAVPSLVRGLRDPNVNLRRNVAITLQALGGGWWPFECGARRVDTSAALSALVTALSDPDSDVRAWSAQAIGDIGSAAVTAVPALIELLRSTDEGSRNSACLALRKIGPAAIDALPALREALSDPSSHVRRFAQMAIDSIEE